MAGLGRLDPRDVLMGVDRGELRALIRDLGAVPRDMAAELEPAVRDGGEIVLAEMRRRASWSTRIPAATTLTVYGTKARIAVSSQRAPHARPFEGLSGDPFRHPVYGHRDRPWVDQAARPFFFGAARDKADEVRERIGESVDRVLDRHGF